MYHNPAFLYSIIDDKHKKYCSHPNFTVGINITNRSDYSFNPWKNYIIRKEINDRFLYFHSRGCLV